jgi:uncharacterized membrane protein (DUF106 family)
MIDLSVLNLKLIQIHKLQELKEKIKELEEEIELLKKSHSKMYDV